jgi:uncharacterized protein
MTLSKRHVAKYSRWLHIYVSMASCALVFFFAVTGVTLNHLDWFGGAERTTQAKGRLDSAWTNTGAGDIAKLDVVEYLRRTHQLGGTVTDLRVDDEQCAISFKGPGYSADVAIDRRTGDYELTETRFGFVATMNDLHKGRDTGAVWRAAIDVSAGLLVLISLSGLILIWFVHRHRLAGLLLLVCGAVVSALVYAIWGQ